MKKQTTLSIDGVKYLLRMCIQLLLQVALIFVVAGTFDIGVQLRNYLVILAGSYLVQLGVLSHRNPEVLNERVKNISSGTKWWDKILLSMYVIFTFVVMNIFIGLDTRFGWSHVGFNYTLAGFALYVLSVIVNTKSMLTNQYFESSSRIQRERNQTVVSTGVYAVVRHPGYSSVLLWALSVPLLSGAMYTFIPSSGIILLIFIRTYLEDKMLKEELKGYREYAGKVKYRLIPFVW